MNGNSGEQWLSEHGLYLREQEVVVRMGGARGLNANGFSL